MIPVVETFYSIQGEGPFVGNPSIFIRLGGCNLKCKGFGCKVNINGEEITGCDTIYAVDTKHFKDKWNYYSSFQELVEDVEKLINLKNNYYKPDIVITGGEPTLYINNPVLIDTITYFISRGYRVTVETNATQEINFKKNNILKKVNFIMSVKLSSSGEPEYKRIKPEVINSILKETEYSCFKFVVDSKMCKEGLSEIFDILKTVPYYADVFLMPLGENKEEIDSNIIAVADACKNFGFKLSDRLHIRVWGNVPKT